MNTKNSKENVTGNADLFGLMFVKTVRLATRQKSTSTDSAKADQNHKDRDRQQR